MKKIILSLALLISSHSLFAQTLKLASPDGKIILSVSDQGKPNYEMSFLGESIIIPSRLGLAFKDTIAFSDGFTILSSETQSAKEVWQLPWGERKNVTDEHNELLVTFSRNNKKHTKEFKVRFRLFNDGIGFRYEVPKQQDIDHVEIINEFTEFVVNDADKATAWWIPARGWNRYEYIYNTTKLC